MTGEGGGGWAPLILLPHQQLHSHHATDSKIILFSHKPQAICDLNRKCNEANLRTILVGPSDFVLFAQQNLSKAERNTLHVK